MDKTLSALRSVLAVIVGYVVMVVLITLVQEGAFGGVGWYESSIPVLLVAGLGTCLSGVVGAYVTGPVSGKRALPHAAVMAGLTVVEMIALSVTGKLSGPVWFDVIAEASLFAAILVGGVLGDARRQLVPQP